MGKWFCSSSTPTEVRSSTLRPARQFDHLCQRLAPALPPACWRRTCGQSGLWGHGHQRRLRRSCCCVWPTKPRSIWSSQLENRRMLHWRFKRLSGRSRDLETVRSVRLSAVVQQDEIVNLVAASTEAHFLDRPGGIFVRRPEQMSDEDRILMQSVARVVLTDSGGTLADQIESRGRRELNMPPPRWFLTRNRRADVIPS